MSPIKRYDQTQTAWTYLSQGRQGLTGITGPANPGVPSGGTTGQLLSKIDGTTNNTAWINNPIPVGGIAGDAVLKTTNANYDTQWSSPVPVGTIYQFGGATAPTGYLICEGQSVSTTTFARLFSIIGYSYGGSGANFTIPNLKGRVPVGLDSAQTEFNVRGEVGGAKNHTLSINEMPVHTHTQNSHNHSQNSHNHSQNAHTHPMAHDSLGTRSVYSEGDAGNFTIGSDDSNVAITYWGFNGTYRFGSFVGATATNNATTATNIATTATNLNTGGGEAHNNLQPYIALNHIIKT